MLGKGCRANRDRLSYPVGLTRPLSVLYMCVCEFVGVVFLGVSGEVKDSGVGEIRDEGCVGEQIVPQQRYRVKGEESCTILHLSDRRWPHTR